ncbi:MAG: AAA family ATPase [Deltaproteobacteria bacterium]|nr:AAA family ATPase [Deltaproteobacteria bacterium]
MINSLDLKNLTVFEELHLDFGGRLNVFVGPNGAGKSHLLKVLYSVLATSARGPRETKETAPTKQYLQPALARKLTAVFRPDQLGRLARRQAGRNRCEVALSFDEPDLDIAFHLNTASKSEVLLTKVPATWVEKQPAFLPTRELLTTYPNFVSLYETTDLPFEETWRDTCILLGAPLARGPRERHIRKLLEPIEDAMGGKIVLEDTGQFYLRTQTGNMEMHLVAEGLRKLAMVARLIATGSLLDKGFLFWDEPEANLNPALITRMASAIRAIGNNGVQVFIATHSLFLLRELYLLGDSDARYFGLHFEGDGVQCTQGSSMDDIGNVAALEAEVAQSDRYLKLANAAGDGATDS